MPIVGAVPAEYAIGAKLFRKQGLAVTPTTITSGAVGAPKILSGDLDMTFSNYVSLIEAYSKGLDVRIVAEASRAAPNNFGIVALPDSEIQRPTDLRGSTIGVNALNNVATLTTNAVLGTYGIHPGDVDYVKFGFPSMITALTRKQVDAAFLPEPFLTQAKVNLGVRTLLNPCSGPTQGLPIDGYAVTGEFAKKNPETLRAFRNGLRAGKKACTDFQTLVSQIRQTTKVDKTIASLVSRSDYPMSLNATSIQRVADLMLEYRVLTKPVNVTDMIVQ